MIALTYDGTIRLRNDLPTPEPDSGEVLVRVEIAGICNTDVELAKGYMDFSGTLGHEFVGTVESGPRHLVGQRVAGEINVSCGRCQTCRSLGKNHCPHRTVLGILNKDGAFAEYLTLPEENLHVIPRELSDAAAAFIEPLAAACRIQQQINFVQDERVAIVGDGKLGLLIGEVLGRTLKNVTLFGKHANKMKLVGDVLNTAHIEDSPSRCFDVVVDASGRPDGLKRAMEMVRPMGTVVLKSTCATTSEFHTAPIVIDELTIIGSRCGPFDKAIRFVTEHDIALEKYVTDTYPLSNAQEAFSRAEEPGVLKIQLACRSD